MTCSECVFWKQAQQPPQAQMFGGPPLPPGFGNCRRNSPIVVPVPTMGMPSPPPTVWPVTREDDSCGDFKEKTA